MKNGETFAVSMKIILNYWHPYFQGIKKYTDYGNQKTILLHPYSKSEEYQIFVTPTLNSRTVGYLNGNTGKLLTVLPVCEIFFPSFPSISISGNLVIFGRFPVQ